jgi:hypothetical protein
MASEYLARKEEIIDGVYPLGALIRRSVGGAIYETEFGESAAPAVIKIREVESGEAEILRQHLRNAGQLAHPNLLKIYTTGSSMLNGLPIFYVVMERADESLEVVLAERALTESATREMLVPALEAVDYLHKKGYAHSRLRPSNVLAVNDQLKLSTDNVLPLNDGTAAEDMRGLGLLIVRALTLKNLNANDRWESLEFEQIPQPLADIVRHCLDPDGAKRWTVEEVKARLNGPLNGPAVVVENTPQPEEDPVAGGLAVAGGPKTGVPKWIYVGLAAVILIVVLAAAMRHKDSAPVAIPAATATTQDRQVPATDPTIAESAGPVEAPSLPVTPAPRPEAPQAVSRPHEKKASGWSVIVGAYGFREPAEKRMREMTKRWPNFEISVLESHAEKTPFLVVLGRNLSEDQAQALRKRAIESGLPGDTYIKRVI